MNECSGSKVTHNFKTVIYFFLVKKHNLLFAYLGRFTDHIWNFFLSTLYNHQTSVPKSPEAADMMSTRFVVLVSSL